MCYCLQRVYCPPRLLKGYLVQPTTPQHVYIPPRSRALSNSGTGQHCCPVLEPATCFQNWLPRSRTGQACHSIQGQGLRFSLRVQDLGQVTIIIIRSGTEQGSRSGQNMYSLSMSADSIFRGRYSGLSINRTPIMRIRAIGLRLVTVVLQQEKANLPYERLSRTLQHFFHAVRDLDHYLQLTNQLIKAANAVVYCITVWQIKNAIIQRYT